MASSRIYGGRLPAATEANALSHWFAGTLRLLRGSVEVFATKLLRAKPLEVVTPTAVVGVRDTQFRVGLDEDTSGRTRAEVIEAAVWLDAGAAAVGAYVPMGFGAAIDASAAAPTSARPLGAPDLSTLPERFKRDEAAPLRVQVASDSGFDKVVSDQKVGAGGEARIVGLDDAPWFLRARHIDAQGIEGLDASRQFV